MDKNALCGKLYDDISEVLNKKRSSFRDVVDKDIENLNTDVGEALIEQIADDEEYNDLPPLNINKLTGFDG